jgi:hypothetical protein
MYDPVEFFAAHGTADLWNTGRALGRGTGSEHFSSYIGKVAVRAVAARKGRQVGIREYSALRSGVLRNALA